MIAATVEDGVGVGVATADVDVGTVVAVGTTPGSLAHPATEMRSTATHTSVPTRLTDIKRLWRSGALSRLPIMGIAPSSDLGFSRR
ncbi:MAG: hypothetical protein H8D74_00425 [Chloroflexi bacterium]|nr:hypothetical protein [Chloroflexota bacterium]